MEENGETAGIEKKEETGEGSRSRSFPYLGDVYVRLGVESSSAADDDEEGCAEQLGDQGATEAGGGGHQGAPAQGVG